MRPHQQPPIRSYPAHLWMLCLFGLLAVGSARAEMELSVTIEGLSGELLENVQGLLSIERQKAHPELNEWRLQRLHDKAEDEIARALQPFGYYRPTIRGELGQDDTGIWLASYQVEKGPALRIAEADIQLQGEAAEEPEFIALLAEQPLKVPAVLVHSEYEAFKRDLQQLAARLGYFDARFIQREVQVDLDSYRARVVLHFDSGPRYRLGEVRFEYVGDMPLNEGLLRRYIGFKPGEPYRATELTDLQNAYNNSEYFELVDIRALPEQATADRQVPVVARLEMRKRNRYSIGLGYGTDTGTRITAGWERRYVNRRGHRFALEVMDSETRDRAEARYTMPMGNPRTDRWIIRSEYNSEFLEDIEIETLLVGTAIEKVEGPWRRSIGLDYQIEEFVVDGVKGEAELLMPTLGWRRVNTTQPLFSEHGWQLALQLRGAREGILSDHTFAQALVGGKYLYPLGDGRLIARGELGGSWLPEGDELAPSVRFFAGGDYSVRGYEYKSLGPVDSAGNVIGGQHLVTASLEYEHPLSEKWNAAIFYDTGNAFNSFDDMQLAEGAGFGARRRLPFGWLRGDIAWALSEDDQPWRLHITLGADL